MEKPHKRFFSVREAAVYTGLSVTGIYRKLGERSIRHYQVGGKKVLDIKDLNSFVLSNEVKSPEQLRRILKEKLGEKRKKAG